MPLESIELTSRHVLPERLFKVAARGEKFQTDELQHLKNCMFCQERLQQFLRQKLRYEEHPTRRQAG